MFSISFVLRILVSSEASAFSVSLSEEDKNDEYHTGLSCQGHEVLKPAATDYHQSVLSIGVITWFTVTGFFRSRGRGSLLHMESVLKLEGEGEMIGVEAMLLYFSRITQKCYHKNL